MEMKLLRHQAFAQAQTENHHAEEPTAHSQDAAHLPEQVAKAETVVQTHKEPERLLHVQKTAAQPLAARETSQNQNELDELGTLKYVQCRHHGMLSNEVFYHIPDESAACAPLQFQQEVEHPVVSDLDQSRPANACIFENVPAWLLHKLCIVEFCQKSNEIANSDPE